MEFVYALECRGGGCVTVSVDVSEVRTLAVDLARIPDKVQRGVRPVVFKGARQVQDRMRKDMRESPSFKGNAPNINFDVVVDGGGVEARIGPKPTWLAHIAYFGGANGGGGTVDILGPLGEEVEPFTSALGDLLEGVL